MDRPSAEIHCSTIMKFRGATLKHATIYLDCPKIKGAAYTALSRVARRKDYLLGGYLFPHHFTPADGRRRWNAGKLNTKKGHRALDISFLR